MKGGGEGASGGERTAGQPKEPLFLMSRLSLTFGPPLKVIQRFTVSRLASATLTD